MPNSTPSEAARSSTRSKRGARSIEAAPGQNHEKGRETGFAGVIELSALAKWLHSEPSDAKGWKVLKVLTELSLAKVDMSASTRSFSDEELRVEAGLDVDVDWRNVDRWWRARRQRILAALIDAGVETEPVLHRDAHPGGGRGNKAVNSWRTGDSIVPGANTSPGSDLPLGEPVVADSPSEISYWLLAEKPVKLSSRLLRWLFRDGRIEVGSARHRVLRANILSFGFFVIGIGILTTLSMALVSRPLATQHVAAVIIVSAGLYMWWQKWRPVVYAKEDRISPLPDEWLASDEAPAQIERKRTESGEILRIVRYGSTCPVCGADMYLGSAAPEWPRRIVGRCVDAPREHVFTFDPVLLTGKRL